MKKRITLILFSVLSLAIIVQAQQINIRSVPVISSNQSDFYPSFSRALGYLSIALEDSLAGHFINPAKASDLNGLTFFFSPTRNSWSEEEGSTLVTNTGSTKYFGTTINSMPFGAFVKKGDFFAGISLAYQSYTSERSLTDYYQANKLTKNDVGNNTFLFALFGKYFPELNLSVAGSFSRNDYKAIDGVNLLYPGSSDIKQDGKATEYKFGIMSELTAADKIEFVLGRSINKFSHEVSLSSPPWVSWIRPGTEINKDESNGWVMHAKYLRKINNNWKVGSIITVNWKEHPKIPNYSLANIPRDPGLSEAYNLGTGFTYSGERSTAGIEYIYEPVSSYTWAEAGTNSIWPASFKTVENYFDFYNHIIRAGISLQTGYSWLDCSLGTQFHFYKYYLKQNNNIARSSRSAGESWLETTLTGGISIKFSNFQMLCSMQLILGNGIVGLQGGDITTDSFDSAGREFIIAPSGKIAVDNIPLFTQQVSFIYNL